MILQKSYDDLLLKKNHFSFVLLNIFADTIVFYNIINVFTVNQMGHL